MHVRVYWGWVVQKSPSWECCKGNPNPLGTLKALFAHLDPAPFLAMMPLALLLAPLIGFLFPELALPGLETPFLSFF